MIMVKMPRLPFALMLMSLLSIPLLGQEATTAAETVEAWLNTQDRTTRYQEIRAAFVEVLETAESLHVPHTLIVELANEGAVKSVRANVLIRALKAELDRLDRARRSLMAADALPDDTAQLQVALKTMSLAIQSGIDADLLSKVVAAAEELDRAVTVIAALSEIVGYTRIHQTDLEALGIALVESTMDRDGVSSIPSVFLKGALAGMSASEITRLVRRVLESGGGIIQIDRELGIRGRDR